MPKDSMDRYEYMLRREASPEVAITVSKRDARSYRGHGTTFLVDGSDRARVGTAGMAAMILVPRLYSRKSKVFVWVSRRAGEPACLT